MFVAITLCAVLLSFGLPLFSYSIGWVLLAAIVVSVLFCDWSVWHVHVGNKALRVGNHARAVTAFTRAIKADPNQPARYYCRAVARACSRDLDAAIADHTKALELDRRYAPAWIGRADAKRQQGEFQAAIDDATVGLCVVPADPNSQMFRVSGLVVRGACYWALGRLQEAFEELDEAVRMAPNSEMPYSMRGSVHLDAKDFKRALDDFDEALDRGARDHATLVNRAIALFKLRRYETAFQEIQACRRDYPEAIDPLCTHAWFLATCPEESFRDGRTALALARTASRLAAAADWACEASLAAAYAELGQFDEAVEHAEKTLELTPVAQHPNFVGPLAAYRRQQPYRDHGLDGLT